MSRELDFFRAVQTENLVPGSKRLEILLKDTFAEVLDFLTDVMRIFHTSEGSKESNHRHVQIVAHIYIEVKSRVHTYATIAWKPFHFEGTIERMKEYRTAVVAELSLLQIITLKQLSLVLSRKDDMGDDAVGPSYP